MQAYVDKVNDFNEIWSQIPEDDDDFSSSAIDRCCNELDRQVKIYEKSEGYVKKKQLITLKLWYNFLESIKLVLSWHPNF